MKTISTGTMMRFNDAALIEAARPKRAVATWLPVPATRPATTRSATTNKAAANKARTPTKSLWIPLPKESFSQKLVAGVLVVAAVAAIGYGFSSLLDLVQKWASFNAWVGQIL
jgi:hypothetical protein